MAPFEYWIDTTWQNWTSSTATTLITNQTWKLWNYNNTSTLTTHGYAYEAWCNANTTEKILYRIEPPPPETSEQRAERVAARERHQEEERARRLVAYTKARSLLMDSLTDEQRREFMAHERFHVTTRAGRRYRIDCGRAHNVFRVNEAGLAIVEYCAHVRESVPDEDNILAQKLLLEHDEEAFLTTANQRVLAG